MVRAALLLLYLWASPTVLLALLGFLPLWALRQVRPVRVRDGAWEWEVVHGSQLWRRYSLRGGWSGTALSWLLVFSPGAAESESTARHERRHLRQSLWLGPLYLPVYLALAAVFGYHRHPMEIDARRAE